MVEGRKKREEKNKGKKSRDSSKMKKNNFVTVSTVNLHKQ